jgi:hypothetical protein
MEFLQLMIFFMNIFISYFDEEKDNNFEITLNSPCILFFLLMSILFYRMRTFSLEDTDSNKATK